MRAASSSPKAALSELLVIRAAGEFRSGSPLRSAGRINEKLCEFNTFSPGPSIPFHKKGAPP
jgi:hypothetical protein